MTSLDTVLARMRKMGAATAMFWQAEEYTYGTFFEMIEAWQGRLAENGIFRGAVCAVLSDYSPQTCALH